VVPTFRITRLFAAMTLVACSLLVAACSPVKVVDTTGALAVDLAGTETCASLDNYVDGMYAITSLSNESGSDLSLGEVTAQELDNITFTTSVYEVKGESWVTWEWIDPAAAGYPVWHESVPSAGAVIAAGDHRYQLLARVTVTDRTRSATVGPFAIYYTDGTGKSYSARSANSLAIRRPC
jgi:hypothetical protein